MKSRVITAFTGASLLALILVSLPGTVQAGPGASFLLMPSTQTVNVGQIFSIDIQMDAGTQEVDVAEAHVDFDINYLEVVDEFGNVIEGTADDVISPSAITTTHLTTKLKNRVDNTKGHADIVYGIPVGGTPSSGAFVLGTIRFKAIAETTGTAVTFHTSGLRNTMAVRLGADVTGNRGNGNVIVTSSDTPPLAVTVTSPSDGSATNNPKQTVSGTIGDKTITQATLILNGKPQTIAITDGSFKQPVELLEGLNTILISAINPAGNTGSSEITVNLLTKPLEESASATSPAKDNQAADSPAEQPPAPPPPTAPQTNPFNWLVLTGIIVGITVVGLLVYFSVRRRYY